MQRRGRTVAATADATRDDQLQDPATQLRAAPSGLITQNPERRQNESEPLRTERKTRHVPIPETGHAVSDRNGLEKAVAVMETAIRNRDAVQIATIHHDAEGIARRDAYEIRRTGCPKRRRPIGQAMAYPT